jgi:multidrug efflux system outer membrane protein
MSPSADSRQTQPNRMTVQRILPSMGLALVCATLCALIPSCTVGPNYKRPDEQLPTTFRSPATQLAPGTLGRDWWQLFGDPVLDQLIQDARAANTDVQAAMARVAQARAAARVTGSQFYPVITADPSMSRNRTPSTGNPAFATVGGGGTTAGGSSTGAGAGGRTVSSYRIPFDLTYEVDIWGRVRRSYEASQASARASAYDFEVVLQTLESDVAQNYFNIRFLDLQARIVGQTVESYRRQLDLTNKQFRAGLVGQTDMAQAESQLNSTLTQEVEIQRQRLDAEHALAVLLGRPASDVTVAVMPLDLAPPPIPQILPGELLRRRPDVAEAEQNLVAANANVGVAIANFYPTLQLNAAAGFQSTDFQSILNWQQRFWSIGPSLAMPIFEGGRLTASLEQARARYDELVATYRGTVLGAVRDVEDSLTDLRLRAEAARVQELAVRSSREYLRLAQLQYTQGLISYLTVIDAERTLLNNELSAAQILDQRLTSTVLLIKSMGGGWEPPAR